MMASIERSAEDMARDVFRRLERQRPISDLRLLKERCNSFADGMNRIVRQFQSNAGREMRPRLDQLERIRNEIVHNATDADGQFRLYVVGPGKAGKSSTINALVNANVAEVKVTPCTWRVDVYAQRNGRCSIHDFHGNVHFGSAAAIAAIVAEDEKKRRESEQYVREEFRRRRENLDLPARLELKAQLRRDHLYQSPYIEARWSIVENSIIDGIWLVDTPGLNQEDPMGSDGSQRRNVVDQRAREYYSRADGVLWILDAQTIASIGSKKALDDIQSAFEDLGGIAENVIGVLNRVDLIRNDMGEQAVERVLDDARTRFEGLFSKIIAFSAYEARPDASPVEREHSGLNELHESIDGFFRQSAGALRLNARSNGQSSYERATIEISTEYASQLGRDTQDYNSRKRIITKACEKAVTSIRSMVEKWASENLARIEKNIEQKILALWDEKTQYLATQRLNNNIIEVTLVETAYRNLIAEIERAREHLIDMHEKTVCFCEYKYLDFIQKTSVIPPYSGKSPAQATFSVTISPEPGIWREVTRFWESISNSKQKALMMDVQNALTANTDSANKWGEAIIKDARQSMLQQLDDSFKAVHLPVTHVPRFHKQIEEIESLSRRPASFAGAPGLLIGRQNYLTIRTKEMFAS